MSTLSIDQQVFLDACKVTAAFLTLLSVLLVFQGVYKLRLTAIAQKKKERFDRYNDVRMLPVDRTIGNLLEWALPFLGMFWMSMILTDGATITTGWVYVAARCLYPIAAMNGGIGSVGAKAPILIATVPGYIALVMLSTQTIGALL